MVSLQVLALHLTGLSLSGGVNPRQLDAFLEAVPVARVLKITRMGMGGRSGRKLVMDSGGAATSSSAGALTGLGRSGNYPENEEMLSLRSSSPVGDSTGSPVGGWNEDEPGQITFQQQHQQEEEYGMLVMTRSAVSLSARIAMLHVDHFVKGDIPVILKNTASKYGKETEEFLEVAVVRSLVDPRQAPTYELLEVRISPFSANIELLVIEQLIRIYEKEVEMLHKFAVAAPQVRRIPKAFYTLYLSFYPVPFLLTGFRTLFFILFA